MPARPPLPQDSASHGLPRRHGPVGHTTLATIMQPEDAEDHEHDVTVFGLDSPAGEGQVFQYHLDEADEGDEGDEEDDEAEADDDDDDSEDEGSVLAVEHHGFVHQHHPPLSGLPDQASYYHGPDVYLSDDPDMSDDAGAPLVSYVATHLYNDDVDMDAPADEDSDFDFSWAEDLGSTAQSLAALGPEITFPTHAAAMDANADTEGPDILAGMGLAGVGIPTELGFFGQPPLGVAWTHPFSFANPNPTAIGPSNYGLTDFLHHWARQSRVLQGVARGGCPWPAKINSLESEPAQSTEYHELEGDVHDFQGVNWEDIGVTREAARERRRLTYSNYVNLPGSDRWTPDLPDAVLPRRESFFRFRRMDIRRNIHLSHFQLRHVFASTSRSRTFYPTLGTIEQFNPMSGHSRTVMKFSDAPSSQISTVAAGHGVLVAGGFGGEYILRNLDLDELEDTACHEGVITASTSGITNHIAVHQARTSSAPRAAFASNDNCFRLLDVTTETWLAQEALDFAPNCTAVSPDGRLRVMVGDSLDVVITAAESRFSSGEPEILQRLSGHRDYGFACDWADDGWTIATGFQDKTVQIWDARRFTDSTGNAVPVCTLRSEMAGTRSLRFSPIGSGKRVLVAAEEADFINIIDAQTFRSKQTVDVFGELGGISFTNGGQDLMALCCDRTRGGILHLERCGEGREFSWNLDEDELGHGSYHQRRRGSTYDWPRSSFTQEKRIKRGSSRGHREVAAHVEIDPF